MRKRKLIIKCVKASIIMSVFLMVVGLGYYLLSAEVEGMEAEFSKLTRSNSQSTAEYEKLKAEVADSNDAHKFFEDYKASKNADEDSYRKGALLNLLGSIKSKLMLNKLFYTMDVFEELSGEKFVKEKASTIKTTVSVDYQAVDDLRAMQLLKEIEKKFPGYVHIKSFSMSAVKDKITNEDLLNISKGAIPNLVSGKVEFDWYGIKINEIEGPSKEDEV